MADWRLFHLEADWNEIRMRYTNERSEVFEHTALPLFHCPDLTITAEDWVARFRVYEKVSRM